MEKEKKKNTFFRDKYGEFQVWIELPFFLFMIALILLVILGGVFGTIAWLQYRDCPTLCAADGQEPVWTLSEGCACRKNGELKDPLAEPTEIRLR